VKIKNRVVTIYYETGRKTGEQRTAYVHNEPQLSLNDDACLRI